MGRAGGAVRTRVYMNDTPTPQPPQTREWGVHRLISLRRLREPHNGYLDAAGSLDVVEIDRDVVPELERRCSGHGELRVHLADAGFPILGDPLYAPERAQRLAPFTQLHALELHVPLPDGSMRTFVAPWHWRRR